MDLGSVSKIRKEGKGSKNKKKKLGNLGRGRLDPIYKKKLEGLAAFGQLGAASEICAHGITDISDFPTAFPEAEH